MAKLSFDRRKLARLWPEFGWARIPRKRKKVVMREFRTWWSGTINKLLNEPEVALIAAVRSAGGTLVTGLRHHECLRHLAALGLRQQQSPDAQGFVTSHGRYVNRREALELQKAAGRESVAPGGYRGDQLYSEDLY